MYFSKVILEIAKLKLNSENFHMKNRKLNPWKENFHFPPSKKKSLCILILDPKFYQRFIIVCEVVSYKSCKVALLWSKIYGRWTWEEKEVFASPKFHIRKREKEIFGKLWENFSLNEKVNQGKRKIGVNTRV